MSYYNPLFTYHQFISENNPYKYVSAKAGDGNWSDPDHWVQTLDPNYFVYDEDGNIVNGLPDGDEGGLGQRRPTAGIVFDTDVGEFDTGDGPPGSPPGTPERTLDGASRDFAARGAIALSGAAPSGAARDGVTPSSEAPASILSRAPGAAAASDIGGGEVNLSGQSGASASTGGVETVVTPGAGQAPNRSYKDAVSSDIGGGVVDLDAVPADGAPQSGSTGSVETIVAADTVSGVPQTLTGPGSTGFVPMNTDGTPGARFEDPARYFEVTLSAAGTTTVDLFAEIDKLNITGADANLIVDEDWGLFARNNIEVFAGGFTADGSVLTREIVLWGGLMNGSGTIDLIELNLLLGNGTLQNGTLARDSTSPELFGLLYVSQTGALTVENMTLQNGGDPTDSTGGAIHALGALTVHNSTFQNNQAVTGGAIQSVFAPLTIHNSTFQNNQSGISGGAIFARRSNLRRRGLSPPHTSTPSG